jgi:TRAP-type C4-dicarboxylate transport system substrate-binding protein
MSLPKLLLAAAACLVASAANAQIVLKASHQWPGGKGDPRDEMVQIVAREVKAANVGLDVQVFPGSSLFKPREQWGAMTKGQLDMSLFPLDYAAGRHQQFSATLMPGLVGNHDRAMRLNNSQFMTEIKKVIEKAGVIVLADAWLSGAFASKKSCIKGPDTVKGQTFRAAGPAFEQMLAAAGASITSMPSSEIYTALQSGTLDATNTSSESFVSYRLFEQVKCLTAPGENALWFMYEPLLMSKQSFDRLNDAQKKALLDAGKKAEAYFLKEAKEGDDKMIEAFKKAGVEVIEMSKEDYDAWLKVAEASSYKQFSEEVKGGEKLIEMALTVK